MSSNSNRCSVCKELLTVNDKYISVDIALCKLKTVNNLEPLYADSILLICEDCFYKLGLRNSYYMYQVIGNFLHDRFDDFPGKLLPDYFDKIPLLRNDGGFDYLDVDMEVT